jgi:signal transduction histidine kinase
MAIASRYWQFVKELPGRTPLRIRLVAAELALVAIALAAISVAGIDVLSSYLLKQQNQELVAADESETLQTTVQNYLDTEFADGRRALLVHQMSTRFSADWVSDGKVYHVIYPISGYSDMGYPVAVPGPSFSTRAPWLQKFAPVIVGAEVGPARWDVVSSTMAVLTSAGPIEGVLIVGINVSPVYQALNRLTGIDVSVSVVLLLGLLVLGIAVIRASLQPLTKIKRTAEAIAAGDLTQRVPEVDPRTEFGSANRALNRMLGRIEKASHARSSSERAARRSEERMRQFVADVSHELRTPLIAIRGITDDYRHRSGVRAPDLGAGIPDLGAGAPDLGAGAPDLGAGIPDLGAGDLGAGASDPEQVGRISSRAAQCGNGAAAAYNLAGKPMPVELERIISRVEQESDRMAGLLEDLLLLTRLDPHGKLDNRPADLRAIADDSVRDARGAAPNVRVNFSVDPGAALIVEGDQAQLRQVMANLMSSALSRAPDGTSIDVRIGSATCADLQGALSAAEAEPDWWPGLLECTDPDVAAATPAATVLEVTDYGPSLTDEQSRRAFERFCRADRSPAASDSGLRLAIVGALVKAHGGAAWVKRRAGNGATFCIALPLRRELPQACDRDEECAGPDVAETDVACFADGPGMQVSSVTAGVGASGLNGSDSGQQPIWNESGAVDEISF